MSEGWDQNAQLFVNSMGWANEEQPQTSRGSQGCLSCYLLLALRHFIKPPHGRNSSSGHTTTFHIMILCFLDANRPVVGISLLRLHRDEVWLRFELVDDTVRRWKGRPRLDADELGVGLRHVPDAEIRHVREGHGDLLLVLLRAQRDRMRHILQDDGSAVNQTVLQRKITIRLESSFL